MIDRTWTRLEIQELIAEARTWVDVPFKHQGRSRTGVDCIGVLGAAANARGLHITLPTDYTLNPDPQRLMKELRHHFQEIPVSRAIFGDMVVMRFKGVSTHLALLTDKGVLHAARQFRKVVEHGLTDEWRTKIIAAFRLPGRYMDDHNA